MTTDWHERASALRSMASLSERAATGLLVAFAAFTPLIASAAAPKWEMTGDSGKVSVWVDRESMRRNGNEVRANLEWRWVQPADVPDTNGAKTYMLERQVQVSNCSTHAYAIAEGTRYSDARGFDPVSSYSFETPVLRWLDAPSRTIRGGVIDHVCRNAPMPEPAKK